MIMNLQQPRDRYDDAFGGLGHCIVHVVLSLSMENHYPRDWYTYFTWAGMQVNGMRCVMRFAACEKTTSETILLLLNCGLT